MTDIQGECNPDGQESYKAYEGALEMAVFPMELLAIFYRGLQDEWPKRTRVGKYLLAVELIPAVVLLAVFAPLLLLWSATACVFAVVAYLLHLVAMAGTAFDRKLQNLVVRSVNALGPHLVRLAEWHQETAYKEDRDAK